MPTGGDLLHLLLPMLTRQRLLICLEWAIAVRGKNICQNYGL